MIRIAVLGGDGIGPEVVAASLPALRRACEKSGLDVEFPEALVGGAAFDATGHPLPPATLKLCDASQAIFFGAVGGPKYDKIPDPNLRPERGSLLPLRKRYELFANLRPARVYPGLEGQSHLKPEYLKGLDLLVIRELTGGAYFGRKELKADRAFDAIEYKASEIERLMHFAFRAAMGRGRRLTLVHKANVLLTSVLWKKVAEKVSRKYPRVKMDDCYVDAFAMYLVRRPASFDVVATENMMGDILTDEAAEVTGSIGLLPSASLGTRGNRLGSFGLYEPCHGSAPDIAGKGLANPLATLLSAALLLRYSLGREKAARALEDAVARTLADGFRTRDLASPAAKGGKGTRAGRLVSTRQMGEAVLERLEKIRFS